MIRNLLYSIGLSIILLSCNQVPEKVIVELPALRASSVFDADSVYYYTQYYKDQNKEIANSYFNKGIEQEETNPDKAIYYFKRSITLHPTLEAYHKLGAILSKEHSYKEAAKAYYLIVSKAYISNEVGSVYLFGEPNQDDCYEYILNSLLAYKELDRYDMNELGMNIKETQKRLVDDKRFDLDKSSILYKNIMLQFMTDDELAAYSKSKTVFDDFLLGISDSSSVFDIDSKKVQQFDYKDYRYEFGGEESGMNYLFSGYLKEKQDNPDTWIKYNFNHAIRINDSIAAVIYNVDTSVLACPKEMRHIYDRLVTYSKDGQIIDDKIVALQCGDSLKTLKYNKNQFTITSYKRLWKKPYDMNDFDNDLLGVEEIGFNSYIITAEGKIEEQAVKEDALPESVTEEVQNSI